MNPNDFRDKKFFQSDRIWVLAAFLSAYLLFLIQPMITKSLLPFLGGSPSVWNTAMLFFQCMLLAGYGYAFKILSLQQSKISAYVHWGLLGLAILVLLVVKFPDAKTTGLLNDQSPTLWLLQNLTLTVGIPFLTLSATGPLIQLWYVQGRARTFRRDPAFLFVAGNFASFAALLGYPVFIEPNFNLVKQFDLWRLGFLIFALLMALCAWLAMGGQIEDRQQNKNSPPKPNTASLVLNWSRMSLWLGLAFIPSSLMLGATQYLATDIGSFPWLWIAPLSVYLLAFALAYTASYQENWHQKFLILLPFAIITVFLALVFGFRGNIYSQAVIHISVLFILCLALLGELARHRPKYSEDLPRYYLLLAAGGCLGGFFNSILAPILFNTVLEYGLVLVLVPLMLWFSIHLVPAEIKSKTDFAAETKSISKIGFVGATVVIIIANGLLFYFVPIVLNDWGQNNYYFGVSLHRLVFYGNFAVVAALYFQRMPTFFVAMTCFLIVWLATKDTAGNKILFQDRTFFGVHRVLQNKDGSGDWHYLWHGSTLHGTQYSQKPWADAPTSYYTDSGPVGDLMRFFSAGADPRRFAFVGLGVGTLAAYGQEHYQFDFFEIDPMVVDIASNEKYFTYLKNSRAKVAFKVGDARISFRDIDQVRYDAIILDAFSSDAIPIHLLSREAVELYLSRVKDTGYVAFHITNLYLDLAPPLANHAKKLGLGAFIIDDRDISKEDSILRQKKYSRWLVLFKNPDAAAAFIGRFTRWSPLQFSNDDPEWTDNFASVLSVLR